MHVNGDPRTVRTLSGPPVKHSKIGEWFTLLACMLLALPMLIVWLGRPQIQSADEARSIATGLESAQRYERGASSYLIPHYNGRSAMDRMPGLTWSQMLLLRQIGVDEMTGGEATLWCRALSVFFALLAVASVFWVGHSLGGPRTAFYAGLVFIANPLFVFFGRLATDTMPFVALTTLSVAGGLWAIRPLKPAPSVERQFIGWLTCGVGLGLAMLVGGLPGAVLVMLPVLAVLIACPGRISHALGLLAAAVIGILMVLPWAIQVYEAVENPWPRWREAFTWDQGVGLPGFVLDLSRAVGWLIIALLPWSIWLVSAATQPVSSSSRGTRAAMILAWVLAVATLAAVALIPQARGYDDLLLLTPAAAVLIGALFDLYKELAGMGKFPRSWRWSRLVMLAVMAAVSIGLPLAMLFQDRLVAGGYLNGPVVGKTNWWMTVLVIAALLGLSGLTVRWTWRHYPARALIGWSVWMIVLLTLMVYPLMMGPYG